MQNTDEYWQILQILNKLGLLPVQESESRLEKPIKINKQPNTVKYRKILILVRFAQSNSLDICFQPKENDLDS